jgi:hypothetical protein
MRIAVYHSKEMVPYRGDLIPAPENQVGENLERPREDYHTYAFYSLKGSSNPPEIDRLKLVTVRKAPKKFVEALRKFHDENAAGPMAGVGAILFEYDGHTAYSDYYYPKGTHNRMVENASGLGAYLEAIAVKHLNKKGVDKVSTTNRPSNARLRQLKKGGLEGNPPVSARANEWLRSLGRVIKGKR